MSERAFYQGLPSLHRSLKEILSEPELFLPVPESWFVIVTDVKGSTKAVAEGRYREVNTIAASGVIACLNVAQKHNVQIAFLYGGDGVTLLVPAELHEEMIEALKALRANTQVSYGLSLRVGSVQVHDVYASGASVRVAKWSVAPGYDQAVFLGDGLSYADKVIKADMSTGDVGEEEPGAVDLSGLMCRWKDVKPAKSAEEVICVIVQAMRASEQATVYQEVLACFDEIYGSYEKRHPITARALSPSVNIGNLRLKGQLMRGNPDLFSLINEALRALMSSILFRYSLKIGRFDPVVYIQELIAATDTLHLSGTLYTVMMGKESQRIALREALDVLEEKGKLIYGLAPCPSAVVTCYVPRYDKGHTHFLDGTGGGYTQASKEFKAKLRKE